LDRKEHHGAVGTPATKQTCMHVDKRGWVRVEGRMVFLELVWKEGRKEGRKSTVCCQKNCLVWSGLVELVSLTPLFGDLDVLGSCLRLSALLYLSCPVL
jgi:hypothetical protein